MFKMSDFYERALANTEFRYLRNAEDVERFVDNDKRCFCYGAGDFGRRFVRYCKKHSLEIGGFVISDNQNSEKVVMGLPVYHLSEIGEFEDIRIVVAIREELHVEIANEILVQKNHKLKVRYLCDIPQFIVDDFEAEIEERSKWELFGTYEKMAAEFYNPIFRDRTYNVYYGHARMMKRLLGLPLNVAFPDTILEDVGWTGFLMMAEVDYNNIRGNKVYVSGKLWRDYLSTILPHKEVVDIGNYMKYEPSLYSSEKIFEYKKKLGRTLLVFPYHSIKNAEVSYDELSFIDEIEKRKRDFDSVIVCMYFYDIQLHNEKIYKDKGYTIVTAGHVLDHNFTRRLRSIIELADITMSNYLGTQLAYSVFLKKPHYIFKQDMNFYCDDAPGEVDERHYDIESYVKEYNGRYNFNSPIKMPTETSKLLFEVEKLFSRWNEKLTEDQVKIVEDVWGDMSPASP